MDENQRRADERCLLIVEDREDILGLLTTIATLQGWVVAGAKNGPDALKAFSAGRFKLALVDVTLTDGMGGIEVAQSFLRLDPALKIVMMSGSPGDEDRVREAGLGHFLAKPFPPTRLIELLERRI